MLEFRAESARDGCKVCFVNWDPKFRAQIATTKRAVSSLRGPPAKCNFKAHLEQVNEVSSKSGQMTFSRGSSGANRSELASRLVNKRAES